MNVENRTLFIADNLDILRGIDSETIDLIYLDPPFNTKKQYKAPIGSRAEGAEFKDIWTDEDIKGEWHGQIAERHQDLYQAILASESLYDASMRIYLTAMAIRLFEMQRILKPTGSIYLHCDPTASHYLKLVMDSLFGKQNFRNEITWQRRHGFSSAVHQSKRFGVCTDIILFYASSTKHDFSPQYNKEHPYYLEYIEKNFKHIDKNGRRYQATSLTNPSYRPNLIYEYKGFQPPKNGWMIKQEKMEQWDKEGRIHFPSSKSGRLRRKSFVDELKGMPIQNLWDDIKQIGSHAQERTGYPTQKPLALLERIIRASSNEGDMVLDPFCGCATACVASEQLGRQWIGIDISPSAEDITKLRLQEEVDAARFDPDNGNWFNPLTDVIVSSDPPVRTDPPELPGQTLMEGLFPDPAGYTEPELQEFRSKKHLLFGNQEGKCNGCLQLFHYRNITIDHIVPQSQGGSDDLENLQLLCGACNSTKGNRTQQYLINKLREGNIIS